MKRFRRHLLVSLVVCAMCIVGQAIAAESESYHGTVLDAETEEPLEGAVVVVLWFKKTYLSMDGPQYFHKGTEVLTDTNGKFSVDTSPGINWNPFTFMVKDPWIVIFKPGYAPLTPTYAVSLKLGADMYDKLKQGAVVRLPKLKSREDLREFSHLGAVGITDNVPRPRIEKLLRSINNQRRQAGITPFPDS